MEKEMNALFDQLEAKLATAAPALKPIYQVEGTVKKDAAGNVTHLEWVDVSHEDAKRAWNEFGLLVRTVYTKDETPEPLTTPPALIGTTLPITTKICHKIDSSVLAQWCGEQLGIPNLEFTESDNDTDHDFDANTREHKWWNQTEIDETVTKAKERGSLPIWEVGNLLCYFADAGLIPEGNYIVNVSW